MAWKSPKSFSQISTRCTCIRPSPPQGSTYYHDSLYCLILSQPNPTLGCWLLRPQAHACCHFDCVCHPPYHLSVSLCHLQHVALPECGPTTSHAHSTAGLHAIGSTDWFWTDDRQPASRHRPQEAIKPSYSAPHRQPNAYQHDTFTSGTGT